MVCSVDHLASSAAVALLRAGGSAADAALAANAVLAVTSQHLCGLGGDLIALVLEPQVRRPTALVAAGRAGSGADAEALRAEGHTEMPARGDVRCVTVPGCVDGWLALHGRLGRAPLADVLAPAVQLADGGFPASPSLAAAVPQLEGVAGADAYAGVRRAGALVRRPGVARTLTAIAEHGREGFYGGEFGRGLLEMGAGEFTGDDFVRPLAEWTDALGLGALGRTLWTAAPPSAGYLTLAAAWLAERIGVPRDPDDGDWAVALVRAAAAAAADRNEVLHDAADGHVLLSERRLDAQLATVGSVGPARAGGGDTAYLCAVDGDGLAVSLIQSNFHGWGALVVEPRTGVFLHDRGAGFSLRPGHPAEYARGRRPPHTLSPLLVTDGDAKLDSVLGTMGGTAQPEILLQLLARVLVSGEEPGDALAAARWALGADGVVLESHAPPAWEERLQAAGLTVRRVDAWTGAFGHAHVIRAAADGVLAGASDPRSLGGVALGF